MNVNLRIALLLLIAFPVRAQETAIPDIGRFAEWTAGQYQVLAQRGPAVAEPVNQFLNQMLQQYSKYFANGSPKAVARVIVFANRDGFRAYTASVTPVTHAGLRGYCHLKTDEEGNRFYELVTYEHPDLWQTLAHEGFHQFLGYELGLQVAPWLNEGLAQYFETSYVQRGRLQVGRIDPAKLAAAQALLRSRQTPLLTELIQWDRATFYANPEVSYPLSWALVYYLLQSDGTSFYSSAFRKYLQDLKWGRDDGRSFQRRFGRDPNRLQTEFARYILSRRAPS